MELGLKHDEVRIVPYTEEWKTEFEKVKNGIQQNTHLSENRIEHIGSTSIQNMPAKPIIDILVGIDELSSLDDSLLKGLQKIGFYRLKVERSNEIVFAKFTDKTYETKTHFIHLVEFENELWENLLFFRDYLRKYEFAREEYLRIKIEYISRNNTGVIEYTNHKESFVKRILNKK